MADKLRDWLVESFPSKKSESPIEALLYAGWEMMKHRVLISGDAGLSVTQQESVGNYRADFLFQLKNETGELKRLVVEVDGHDFHERTKAQAAHDKARDRWMTGNGYDVIRFTGSEVWANPFKCALDIADRLYLLRHGRTAREARTLAGLEAIRQLIQGG
jgi:very-short-patch-repair endonuclease